MPRPRLYSEEFRRTAIDAVLRDGLSPSECARQLGCNRKSVVAWIEQAGGSLPSQGYSSEFRARVVAAADEPGRTVTEVARAAGVTSRTIRVWQGHDRGIRTAPLPAAERERREAFVEEVAARWTRRGVFG